MKGKFLKYLSTSFLIIGAIIGLYVFIMKSRLPEGVCPVTTNKPLIYSSIVFCALSFILSLFEGKKNN